MYINNTYNNNMMLYTTCTLHAIHSGIIIHLPISLLITIDIHSLSSHRKLYT